MQSAFPKFHFSMENTMKSAATRAIAGMLAAAGLTLAITAMSLPAFAAGKDDPASMQQRFEQMQARMKARIAKMGERLEIKASQQAAWNEYVNSRQAMMAQRPARPAKDADAATVARSRAEFVADMARKLAVVSDATAKLQAVLDDNQKKAFNQMARRSGMLGHRGHHGQRGESHHGAHFGDRGQGPQEGRMPR